MIKDVRSPTFTLQPIRPRITAEALVGPSLELNALIYDAAGPYISAYGYVRVTADALNSPHWRAFAGYGLGAGVRVQVPLAGWDLLQKDFAYSFGAERQIGQADATDSGGGNPPSGEPAPGEPAPKEPSPGEPGPGEPPPAEPAPGEPSPSGGTISLSQGAPGPAGYWYSVALSGFAANSSVTVTCRDSVDPGGFYSQTLATNGSGAASDSTLCYSGDGPDHWVTGGGVTSTTSAGDMSGPARPPASRPAASCTTCGVG